MASLLSVASIASAQTAGDPKVAAAQYTEAGSVAQRNGDYDTAIDLYAKANALVPHPISLFNLAQAHRLAYAAQKTAGGASAAAHRDQARAFYKQFLDTSPEGDLEVTARGWQAKLDEQWAADNPREEAARRAEQERRREALIRAEQDKLRSEREAQAVVEQRIGTAVRDTQRERDQRQAQTLKVVGITGVGLGALTLAAGTYFAISSHRLSTELTDEQVYDLRRIDDGKTAERDMTIAYIAGGVLAVGGVVTYYVGRRIEHRLQNVAMIPSSTGAAFVVGGAF